MSQLFPPEPSSVPLVWEVEPPPELDTGEDDPFPPSRRATAGFWRLVAAAVADAGAVALAVAGCWLVAAASGAGLVPAQLVIAGILGVEVATVAAVTSLLAWRGTPGMLLASAAFHEAIPLFRALRLWLVWLLSLPLLGLPLLVGPRGRRGLECLAGSRLSRRFPAAAA